MGLSGGPEAAAESVAATLVAHLNDAVTIINSKYTDYVLPTIPAANIYTPMRRNMVPEYPAIVVSFWDGNEEMNGAPIWGMDHHHLDISVLCMSDTEDELQKQSLRYLWAIWRTLKVQQGLDGTLSGLSGVDTGRYGRSEAYREGKNPKMMMAAGLEAVVNITETVF